VLREHREPHTQAGVEHARFGHAEGNCGMAVSFGFCSGSAGHALRIGGGNWPRDDRIGAFVDRQVTRSGASTPSKPWVFDAGADASGDTGTQGVACRRHDAAAEVRAVHADDHGGPRGIGEASEVLQRTSTLRADAGRVR